MSGFVPEVAAVSLRLCAAFQNHLCLDCLAAAVGGDKYTLRSCRYCFFFFHESFEVLSAFMEIKPLLNKTVSQALGEVAHKHLFFLPTTPSLVRLVQCFTRNWNQHLLFAFLTFRLFSGRRSETQYYRREGILTRTKHAKCLCFVLSGARCFTLSLS